MKDSLILQDLHATLDGFNLKDVNLTIPKGSICGLVGRSGAGKTTLIKVINGARFLMSGDIIINGNTYHDDELNIRQNMSTVYDVVDLNPFTKPKRLLKAYKNNHPNFNEGLFNHLKNMLNLELNKSFKKLSLGMQKKVMLAFALAVEPKLLILDEPTIGIDVVDKVNIYQMVQSYMENEDNAVIFSSHQVDDVEKISDYIAFIDQGEIVLFENKETLLSSYVYCNLDKDNPHVSLLEAPRKTAFGVEGIMKQGEAQKHQIAHQRASLEQIFMHICGKERS